MRNILLVCAFLAVLAISSIEARDRNRTMDNDWDQFKRNCSKNYNKTEENDRRIKWEDNFQMVKKHNSNKGKTFELEANEFADLSSDEFNKIYNRLQVQARKRRSIPAEEYVLSRAIPTSINWVTLGAVSSVKNQGACGSCWAFAATAAVESAYKISKAKLVDLSEQNVLDCSSNSKYGNAGCNGGWMNAAFQYIIDNKGIDTEAFYPYKAIKQTCKYNSKYIGATISKYVKIASGSEAALTNAVATVGPVVVAIDAVRKCLYFILIVILN